MLNTRKKYICKLCICFLKDDLGNVALEQGQGRSIQSYFIVILLCNYLRWLGVMVQGF